MVAQKTSQVRKMVGLQTGFRQVALIRMAFGLALCAFSLGLGPVATAWHSDPDVPQPASALSSVRQDALQVMYRTISGPNGASEVQRSVDDGHTWTRGGVVPEAVLQLAPSPIDDTVVFARTDANLWRSETGGASWARVTSLPGRLEALVVSGHSGASGLVFLGTDTQGLYSSIDSGRTWQAAGGGLSTAGASSLSINALAISPGDEQVVYAAATFSMATPQGLHNRQLAFISVDNGSRWFEFTLAPPVDQPITQLSPLAGSLLTVLIPSPSGTQLVSLDVGPEFATGLYDPDPDMRAATARAMGFSHDPSLLPALLMHLGDPDQLAGDQVVQAIGRLGDAAQVPMLIPALSHSDMTVRARAATAVGLLRAEAAIPQLSTMLRHDAPLASRQAAEALAAIGTPSAMSALMGPLADQQMTSARHITMGVLETTGQASVPVVVAALNGSSAALRANAAEVLGWLSPVADPLQRANARSELDRLLSDPDAAVQAQAAWALGEIGAAPARVELVPTPLAVHTVAPVPVAKAPGALSDNWVNYWTLAARAVLLLLALVAVALMWKGPRPRAHLGHT